MPETKPCTYIPGYTCTADRCPDDCDLPRTCITCGSLPCVQNDKDMLPIDDGCWMPPSHYRAHSATHVDASWYYMVWTKHVLALLDEVREDQEEDEPAHLPCTICGGKMERPINANAISESAVHYICWQCRKAEKDLTPVTTWHVAQYVLGDALDEMAHTMRREVD